MIMWIRAGTGPSSSKPNNAEEQPEVADSSLDMSWHANVGTPYNYFAMFHKISTYARVYLKVQSCTRIIVYQYVTIRTYNQSDILIWYILYHIIDSIANWNWLVLDIPALCCHSPSATITQQTSHRISSPRTVLKTAPEKVSDVPHVSETIAPSRQRRQENWLTNRSMGPSFPLFLASCLGQTVRQSDRRPSGLE